MRLILRHQDLESGTSCNTQLSEMPLNATRLQTILQGIAVTLFTFYYFIKHPVPPPPTPPSPCPLTQSTLSRLNVLSLSQAATTQEIVGHISYRGPCFHTLFFYIFSK